MLSFLPFYFCIFNIKVVPLHPKSVLTQGVIIV
nr:MAG TPA: hypothetical protein [Caudoviricetes sp.]